MQRQLSIALSLACSLGLLSCENNPAKSNVKVPEVITTEVSDITTTTARSGGTIISDRGYTVLTRGVCWNKEDTPTINDRITSDGPGAGEFNSYIIGLNSNTFYYIRAYATNDFGTGYGETISFKTQKFQRGTLTDIDGNTYQTVKIGSQWWMAENLMVTHYHNGDEIPNVTNDENWHNIASYQFTGAYCVYNNTASNANTYGLLYNWYAVKDVRGLAPEGWHVPTAAEWQTLVEYLGGVDFAGGKMKKIGTRRWFPPNTGATNESGFNALPAGLRYGNGIFKDVRLTANFWSSQEHYQPNSTLWVRTLEYNSSIIYRNRQDASSGFSVRCVRN